MPLLFYLPFIIFTAMIPEPARPRASGKSIRERVRLEDFR